MAYSMHTWRRAAGAAAALAATAALALAAAAPADAQGDRRGAACFDEGASWWTDTESWVWEQLCNHRPADFDQAEERFGPRPDGTAASGWPQAREVRALFLEDVLLDDPWRQHVIGERLWISGALITGSVNLDHAEIPGSVLLTDSRIDGELNLINATVRGDLNLERSAVGDGVNLKGARIDGALLLRITAERISLPGVVVGTDLALDSAEVGGTVTATSAELGGSLILDGAFFSDHVDLTGITVGRNVQTDAETRFHGELTIDHATIGARLGLAGEFRAEVGLANTFVNGDVSLSHGLFYEPIYLTRVRTGGSVLARAARFDGEVRLGNAEISQNADLRGARFSGLVDMSGARVRGDLRLGIMDDAITGWEGAGWLSLRGATVGGIDDHPGAWPATLELSGFRYERGVGRTGSADGGFVSRGSEWLTGWLERHQPFARQPYEQLERVVRGAGLGRDADDIAIARKERARESHPWLQQAMGIMHREAVGYGYRPERALWYVLGFAVVGYLVARFLPEWRKQNHVERSLLFSIDRLLPVISFSETHARAEIAQMPTAASVYFAVHTVAGYVLGLFLLAALSGITTT